MLYDLLSYISEDTLQHILSHITLLKNNHSNLADQRKQRPLIWSLISFAVRIDNVIVSAMYFTDVNIAVYDASFHYKQVYPYC